MGPAANAAVSTKWRDRMSRWRRSGLSIAEFCRREQISQPSFFGWRKRLVGDRAVANRRGRQLGGRPEPEAAVRRAVAGTCLADDIGHSDFIARRGDRHAATAGCCRAGNHRHSQGVIRRHGGRSPVLNVPTPVRVFLYTASTDMRKSFSPVFTA